MMLILIQIQCSQYYILMIGFKGNLPKAVTSSQALIPIVKYAQQARKSSQYCVDFLISITKFQQVRANFNTKIIYDNSNYEFSDKFNKNLWEIIVKIVNQYKSLWQNTKLCTQPAIEVCSEAFANLSAKITQLEQSISNYSGQEDIAIEMSKKYYKVHKTMLAAIDQYKASFSDVNIIYNMDEKIRRYQHCQNLYKNALLEFNAINHQCNILYQLKTNAINIYEEVQKTQVFAIKKLGEHFIHKTKQCMECYHLSTKNIKIMLNQYQNSSEIIQITSLFKNPIDLSMLQYFNEKQKINVSTQLPFLIQYHHLLKQEYFTMYNVEIQSYITLIQDRLEKRKIQNKRIFQNISAYFKNIQKIQTTGAKEILINFQKWRKKISECFGNRFVSFLKALNSVFQISAGVNQKLIKNINSILHSIQNSIHQDSKLLKLLNQEAKQNIQRFILKKQITKQPKEQSKQGGAEESLQSSVSSRLARKQLSQKAQFLKHLVTGFRQKFDKNQIKLMNYYNDLMSAVSNSNNQFYSFCNEYLQLYFGAKQFEGNFQKYCTDLDATLQKNNQFFKETALGSLRTSNLKITFDGQFKKIQDFKKIKKPTSIQASTTDAQQNQTVETLKKTNRVNSLNSMSQQQQKSIKDARSLVEDEKQLRNAEFLKQKIIFKENQKLIKSFSCALAERIVLQGKIYITNYRVCFHSNFNSENIFFGRTFIQFPKSDIKKIQKRKNSLFLDNSITFTTVNGQVSFTSFFSRNEAYDLICKTFNFNLDDHVYEYCEMQTQKIPQFLLDFEEKDDISINNLQERRIKIQQDMKKLQYHEASSVQIVEEGLNALKLFKIIYSSTEININGRKYQHFLKYIKQCVNHKDLQIDQWEPPLNQIINQSNIKQNAPIKSQRKFRVTVPLANTGVPFMPKTAKSQQTQSLYFYSKHKFVILSSISSKGAPLTDTFNVQLKTTVQSDQEGKCQVSIEYLIDFIKQTMMKSVIQTKSKQEALTNCKVWTTQIKKYFEMNGFKHAKKAKKIKSLESMKIECQTAQNQLKSIKQQNAALKTKLQKANQQIKDWKNRIMASIALHFLIILIFFII